MGEDIHSRIYLKRRLDGKYVNAHEVCEWNPEGSLFDELVSGRNYDLFSLFGSGRGNYKPLDGAEYGIPEFLVGTDFDEYCKDCGFYGFVWFKVSVLEKSLKDFIERLLDLGNPHQQQSPGQSQMPEGSCLQQSSPTAPCRSALS